MVRPLSKVETRSVVNSFCLQAYSVSQLLEVCKFIDKIFQSFWKQLATLLLLHTDRKLCPPKRVHLSKV